MPRRHHDGPGEPPPRTLAEAWTEISAAFPDSEKLKVTREVLRHVYYLGAVAIWEMATNCLAPGEGVTAADMVRMQEWDEEIRAFLDELHAEKQRKKGL